MIADQLAARIAELEGFEQMTSADLAQARATERTTDARLIAIRAVLAELRALRSTLADPPADVEIAPALW